MKEIELTKDKSVVVDDEDYEYLMQWKWYASKEGKSWYAVRKQHIRRENGKPIHQLIRMHRVIAERAGLDMSNLIDHKDRNGLNDCRDNLRPATHKQNTENSGNYSSNKSGVKGVCWKTKQKIWTAQIWHNGKNIHLGSFNNKEDAALARKEAEIQYFTHAPL